MIKVTVVKPRSLDHHVGPRIQRALSDEVGKIAKNARDYIRRMMGRSGGGRVYRRGNSTHVASAPGDFPAVDTGLLQGMIEMRHSGQVAEIGALMGPHYAKYLEKGTKYMEPRPFIEPTRKRYERLGPPRIFRALMRALGRL